MNGFIKYPISVFIWTLIRKTRKLLLCIIKSAIGWSQKEKIKTKKNHRWRVPWKLSPTIADHSRPLPAAIGFSNGITVKSVPQWMVRRMPFAMVFLSLVSISRWKFFETQFLIGSDFFVSYCYCVCLLS